MWLTVGQVSEYLNIKPKTIYRLVSLNSIPYYKVGKLVRFNQSDIDTWMETKRIMPINLDKVVKSLYNPISKGSQATSRREAMK
jgi:excisionase family DNA binding protein